MSGDGDEGGPSLRRQLRARAKRAAIALTSPGRTHTVITLMVVESNSTGVSTPEREAWKVTHRRVLLETDINKLPALAHELESALFIRAQQRDTPIAHDQERHEMQVASNDVLDLKTKRLGWPGSK
jgi:hypothetical protein